MFLLWFFPFHSIHIFQGLRCSCFKKWGADAVSAVGAVGAVVKVPFSGQADHLLKYWDFHDNKYLRGSLGNWQPRDKRCRNTSEQGADSLTCSHISGTPTKDMFETGTLRDLEYWFTFWWSEHCLWMAVRAQVCSEATQARWHQQLTQFATFLRSCSRNFRLKSARFIRCEHCHQGQSTSLRGWHSQDFTWTKVDATIRHPLSGCCRICFCLEQRTVLKACQLFFHGSEHFWIARLRVE